MRQITSGNLTHEERAWSALWGASLSLMAIRRLPSVGGVLFGVAALASDPPASQLPDEPPVNADAKWAAAAAPTRREVDPKKS